MRDKYVNVYAIEKSGNDGDCLASVCILASIEDEQLDALKARLRALWTEKVRIYITNHAECGN